jgi:ferredoxin-type protein NapH
MALKMSYFTVWFLPLVVIGGLFYPQLGYLVVGMMAGLLMLSFFKGRYWCSHLCPRGAFLDLVMAKVSPQKAAPKFFLKMGFRWLVLVLLFLFLAWRIAQTGGSFIAIGFVFVTMCLITTLIAITLGSFFRHRAWCIICPMGTLQEKIFQIRPKKTS